MRPDARQVELAEFFTNDVIADLLEHSLETAALGPDGFTDVGEGPGSTAGRDIDWLTVADRSQAVVEDVERIRAHPLVPARIPIHGYVYEVETGRLVEVEAASEAGRAASRTECELFVVSPTTAEGSAPPSPAARPGSASSPATQATAPREWSRRSSRTAWRARRQPGPAAPSRRPA